MLALTLGLFAHALAMVVPVDSSENSVGCLSFLRGVFTNSAYDRNFPILFWDSDSIGLNRIISATSSGNKNQSKKHRSGIKSMMSTNEDLRMQIANLKSFLKKLDKMEVQLVIMSSSLTKDDMKSVLRETELKKYFKAVIQTRGTSMPERIRQVVDRDSVDNEGILVISGNERDIDEATANKIMAVKLVAGEISEQSKEAIIQAVSKIQESIKRIKSEIMLQNLRELIVV